MISTNDPYTVEELIIPYNNFLYVIPAIQLFTDRIINDI